MSYALVIVDVQNDFCPGGALATDRGFEVASKISELLESSDNRSREYDIVVATQDWHIDPGEHFSSTPDFVDSWPVHCVAHSTGAEIAGQLGSKHFDAVFQKGHYSAAYSGFEGTNQQGVLLGDWLRARGVTGLDICGIATDHCVLATARDALAQGFQVRVLRAMCSPVDAARGAQALATLQDAGAEII